MRGYLCVVGLVIIRVVLLVMLSLIVVFLLCCCRCPFCLLFTCYVVCGVCVVVLLWGACCIVVLFGLCLLCVFCLIGCAPVLVSMFYCCCNAVYHCCCVSPVSHVLYVLYAFVGLFV